MRQIEAAWTCLIFGHSTLLQLPVVFIFGGQAATRTLASFEHQRDGRKADHQTSGRKQTAKSCVTPRVDGGDGYFEDLHGYSNLAKFRDRLLELACLHYGPAGRAYVRHIAHDLRKNRDDFATFVKGRRKQYEQASRA